MRRKEKGGYIGIVVILLALLITGYLVLKNSSIFFGGVTPGSSSNDPQLQLQHMKNEVKKIEELQQKRGQDE